MTTWLLTREADDLHGERAVLESLGRAVIDVPCVETTYLRWPWSEGRGLTFFTSRRAVEAWRRSGAPKLGAVAALSPSTHHALGFEADVTAEGGVVALAAAVLKAGLNEHVRYPTSSAGLASEEQTEALGLLGSVDRQVVYEVSSPAGLSERVAAATASAWSASFASPSAVRHFLNAVPARGPQQIVCFGASTARAWDSRRPADWPAAISTRDLRRTLTEVTS